MNRREFMQCAAIAISGVSASQLGFALSEQQQKFIASLPNYNRGEVDYFSPAQRKIIAAMAETILPRTDTPGAIDAGVPAFVELMVADWMNDDERKIINAGVSDIETRIPRDYGKEFVKLPPDTQLEVMEDLEAAAADSPWYSLTDILPEYRGDAPFICQLKEMVIWGFFTSEVGSTQVLRSNPMPMGFDGNLPLSADESTWSKPL